MSKQILKSGRFGFQLPVQSPYIVCFHHRDLYPVGNGQMEPVSYISSRNKGNDFREDVPYRMYHGDKIPGFPYHPHRGFETITAVTKGFVDHADGLKAAGRYGPGDVQWMTAGKGLQHSEMFPVLDTEKENPLELFQIWLNLPQKNKFVEPYYKMLWKEEIPVLPITDRNGAKTNLTIIHGQYRDVSYQKANPDSFAANPKNHVNIWLLKMEPYSIFSIPAVSESLNRTLYFYEGNNIQIDHKIFSANTYFFLNGNQEIMIENGSKESFLLLLDGEELKEPVVAYGPFVMNTEEEIADAYRDYQRTQFGGWPWKSDEPVHPVDSGRFALYSNGQKIYPPLN